MALFVFSIIFLILAVIAFIVSRIAKADVKRDPDNKDAHSALIWSNGVTAGLLIIALLFLIPACVVQISTQDIGVKTSFGKTVGGGLKPGLHLKAPWEKVHRLDFKTQTDTYASNGDGSTQNNAQGGCISVRIARQATACVNLSIRWQNDQEGVDYLFQNYKTDENIRTNLLHRDLQAAVNVAFSKYDPLGLDKAGESTQPTNAQLGQQVQTALTDQVGQYLKIYSVYIPLFNFDRTTQDRLNQLQQQVAQTRVAQQAEQTAKAQAAANRALSQSVSNDPNVLVSKCLDTLHEAVQSNYQLPAGFSCFGPSNALITAR